MRSLVLGLLLVPLAAGAQAPPFTPPMLPGTPDVATLAAKVKPGVVNITSTHTVRAPELDFPFRPFGRGGTLQQRALGSGFVFDDKGHVLTNAHVVEGAESVRVKLVASSTPR